MPIHNQSEYYIVKGIYLNKTLMKISFWIYITTLYQHTSYQILWYGFGTFELISATIGAIGQF